ncbi:MAG: murein biosynthesis integral membrane protein MurJ, partial [Candidatus Brocadiae bacterium]|nr:murein biosynthesis integral membrane protein MurJ [Candidatus Brocadiia bacterium]
MTERPESFIRGAGVIAAFTFLSRILGLVRDCLCAAFFGVGIVWDAFSFAFRVPNLFRRLFGEGALSAAFVPAFTERLELREKEAAWRFAGRIGGALLLALFALLVVGEALVLGLLRWADPDPRWRLALGLTAVMLPYMVFICLTALAGAALNSLRHFAAPALAPVVLNVCWIASLVVAAWLVSSEATTRIFIVAVGILVAGAAQLALQMATLAAKGFRWRLSFGLLHPDVRRIAISMAPVALGLAALQINVLLDGVIAISLAAPEGKEAFTVLGASIPYPMEVGANSVLYYANRLMQLPLGVFGIALATAAFPTLSSQVVRRDWRGFSQSLTRGLGTVLFVAVPAGVGLILLRYPAVELLFQHGNFALTPGSTARTAAALCAYSTGIWAYCSLHVLTRAFYSLKRPATPAKVAACMVGLNLVLNLTLVWHLREAGLAAATAITATLQVAVLYWVLHG